MSLNLYPYQEEAVDHIVSNGRTLLAYEMGLGKTACTISACERLMDEGRITAPVLVVVLASLKYQWQREIERWAPDSASVVIDGTPAKRKEQYERLFEWRTDPIDYVIVNYETLVRDYPFYENFQRWGALVADEITACKGFRSKRSKAMKKLSKRVPVRIGLTGTPIENGKPEEIFSIMEVVDPEVLGRFDLFDKTFIVRNYQGWVERYRNLPLLNKTLAPAMVRKRQMDDDVKDYLPEVLDQPPYVVPWDRSGVALYRVVADDLVAHLDEAAEMFGDSWSWSVGAHYGQESDSFDPQEVAMRGEIMSRYTALRMLCDHPDLLRMSAEEFKARLHDESAPSTGSKYCYEILDAGLLDKKYGSPKLDALKQYVDDFLDIDPTYKVVVFSTFRRAIPLISDALHRWGVEEFHGGLNAKQKDAAKVRFQTDPDRRVLVSSDAGGFGVDLPQANLLINYSLPWTAGSALQRNSRIIRASSEWEKVRIERFLMQDSVEMRQWEALQYKSRVAEAVLSGEGMDDKGGLVSTVSGLREFLVG